jgi:phosphoserine aminotransferase
VASSADATYNYIPKNYEIPADVDYFHITTNNTIYGTQMAEPTVNVPLVADMSSDIFSRPLDISKYDLIYAGAQKNLGPSGATLVIVKDEALGKVEREIPTMLDYRTHIKSESMFNTPSTLPVFACLQTLRWLKENGGVEAMEKTNIEKAAVLYDEIDRNKMFQCTVPAKEDRSLMNVTFVMTPEYAEYEKEFLDFATSKGMLGIKGHRSVGGFRASTYNAMPVESIQALVAAMQEFEKSK